MNSDLLKGPTDPPAADSLAAFDEALASGSAPPPGVPPPAAEDEALLRLLDQLRPRPAPAEPPEADAESRYVLQGLHGAGGIGQVWLARDTDLGREVALKVLRPEWALDPHQAARFLHEARVTGRLQHPGVVPVYELVDGAGADQPPFYTMRLVPGRTLAEAVRLYHERRGARALPVERARLLNAFVSVCQTVAYAHSRGVIHRDLKPQNVALGDFGEVILLDWGFAKHLGARDEPAAPDAPPTPDRRRVPAGHTLGGQVVGTPSYMAPEQAAGRADADDVRADVYGLGAILYEILTGRPPYVGDEGSEVVREGRAGPPPRPSAVARVPAALESVCLKAMARDPADRYPTPAELAGDVQHWLADEPVSCYREPPRARLRRWARHHPAHVTALVVLLTTALLGIGVAIELVGRERTRFAQAQARAAWDEAELKARARDELQQRLYFHRIALAERTLAALNPSRAIQLLAECPESLRGWEWRCLDRLCRTDPPVLRGHANTVVAVAFSPNGETLVSTGFDRSVRVWDLTTNRARVPATGHEGVVYHLAVSPDGRHVASAGWDGTVRIWEIDTGRPVRTLGGHAEHVNRVAYAGDGRLLSLDQANVLRMWDTQTGRTLWETGRDGDTAWHLMTMAVRPDGRMAAVAGGTSVIRLIDLAEGRVVGRLAGHDKLVRALAFSRDGQFLASGDGDVGRFEPGQIRVWDVERGETVRLLRGHTEPIFALDFHPDGSRLVSASHDQTVKLWDLIGGQEALTLHSHTGPLRCAVFSPDGRQLATAGGDWTVRVWDGTAGDDARPPRLLRDMPDPAGAVFAVAFSPDGRRLTSLGDGRVLRFFDRTGRPDGVSPNLSPDDPTDYFVLSYSPDGRQMATAASNGTLVLLDAATGAVRHRVSAHAAGPIKGLAYSPDGSMLATASWDRTVKLWDAATGEELRTLRGHSEAVNGVAFSPDGKLLASAGNDRMVRVWDPATGDPLHRLPHPSGAVSAVTFSPSGSVLVSAGTDGVLRLWEVGKWGLPRELRGHAGGARAVAFSPDGRLLASAGQDWTVKLWRASGDDEPLTLRGHSERIHSLAFHPDGRSLATAAHDGFVKLWDVTGVEE